MKATSLYFSAAAILPNPNMVQMANISVHPRLNDLEPRKFTKYIPPKKRKSRNSDDFRLQNYPPSERLVNLSTTRCLDALRASAARRHCALKFFRSGLTSALWASSRPSSKRNNSIDSFLNHLSQRW